MKLALIPPVSLLDYCMNRDCQMMLPECLFYSDYRLSGIWKKSEPQLVMLDNGMFEGHPPSDLELVQIAADYNVDEIIAPDIRGDMPATYARQAEFTQFFGRYWPKEGKKPSIMYVLQGQNMNELMHHARRVLENKAVSLPVIGLPRRLAEDVDPWIRIKLAEWIVRTYGPTQFHLLGFSRIDGCSEIASIRHMLGQYVRSIDTDAPFVYAMQDKQLDDSGLVERPEHYFELKPGDLDMELVKDNVDLLAKLVTGRT